MNCDEKWLVILCRDMRCRLTKFVEGEFLAGCFVIPLGNSDLCKRSRVVVCDEESTFVFLEVH